MKVEMKCLFVKLISFLRTEKNLIGLIIFLNTLVIFDVLFSDNFTSKDLHKSLNNFFYVTNFSAITAAILFCIGKFSLPVKKFLKYFLR